MRLKRHFVLCRYVTVIIVACNCFGACALVLFMVRHIVVQMYRTLVLASLVPMVASACALATLGTTALVTLVSLAPTAVQVRV